MKDDDLIRLARQTGATPYTNRHYPDRPTHTFTTFTIDQLREFARLVQQPAPQPHQNDHHQGVIMESKQIEALLAVRRFVENNTVSADNGYAAGVDAANRNVITHIDWLLEQVRAGHEIPFKVEHNSKWPFDARVTSPPTQSAPQPLTEEMVLRAAKELCRIYAGECQVDEQDTWNIYADQFKRDAKAALAAAHGIKEQP